jgi:hypothetical protein
MLPEIPWTCRFNVHSSHLILNEIIIFSIVQYVFASDACRIEATNLVSFSEPTFTMVDSIRSQETSVDLLEQTFIALCKPPLICVIHSVYIHLSSVAIVPFPQCPNSSLATGQEWLMCCNATDMCNAGILNTWIITQHLLFYPNTHFDLKY